LEKLELVPDGVLGGYYRGTGMIRSTWRVLPGSWMFACGIDQGCLRAIIKEFPPFLELISKLTLTKVFFNKDIEMSYDMLYRQEKLDSIG
jgi:hypothetical protein